MRYLITAVMMFCSTIASAEELPAFMKGATISVTLKDGRTYQFKSETHKVVPRLGDMAAAPATSRSKRKPEEAKSGKNRVRLLGGYGRTGLATENNGSTVTVRTSSGLVGGVGYDRMISERWSLGGQALSNGTYTLGVGLDF